jgi:hypothetical protein
MATSLVTRLYLVASVALVVFLGARPLWAQEKGALAYDNQTDAGYLTLRGADNGLATRIWVLQPEGERGILEVFDDGNRGAGLWVRPSGSGQLGLFGSSGNFGISALVDDASGNGRILLLDRTEETRARIYVDDFRQGGLRLYASSGQPGATLAVSDSQDTGFLSLRSAAGDDTARVLVTGNGTGQLELDSPDRDGRVILYVDGADQGGLQLRGAHNDTAAAALFVHDLTDAGILQLFDGQNRAAATLLVDNAAQGDLSLSGDDGVRARLGLDDDQESGFVELRGQRGARLVTAEPVSETAPNNGAVFVYGFNGGNDLLQAILYAAPSQGGGLILANAEGTPTIFLNGATGTIEKAGFNGFLIPDPRDSTREIFYASLEGPEAGIYARGTGRLTNGRAEIVLPAHFAALARAEDITVQLTPGSADTAGLAAVEKRPDRIVVQELAGGSGSFAFDYFVQASRNDVDPIEPVRTRGEFGQIPFVKGERGVEAVSTEIVEQATDAALEEMPADLRGAEKPELGTLGPPETGQTYQ